MSNPMEGDPKVGGAQEPQAPLSQPQDVQQPSPGGAEVTLETVLHKINDLEKQLRGIQSEKDKRIAAEGKLTKKVQGLSEQFRQYKEYRDRGMGENEALREMRIDAILAAQNEIENGTGDQPPVQPGTQPAAEGVDEATLAVLGLSANDPDVTRLLMEGKNSLQDFVGLLKQRATKQTPQPSSILPTGPQAAPKTSAADLQARYDAEIASVFPGDFARLSAVKAKYRKLGLDVW